MARHPFIAIEGVIGVGKTTLVRLLQPDLGGEVVLEEFDVNPFLSDFYADRERYAFQTQIFFLLSRFRQQTTAVPAALRRGPVIADYTYAKDRLFAHLNLEGDELAMYERVYSALGEQVRRPDLLVYLRANLDVLMARIAQRDRPYERNMDRDYIERLRQAYEQFVANYDEGPVLVIDTNELNVVQNTVDRESVIERVKSNLRFGTYQTQLPGVDDAPVREPQVILKELEAGLHTLADFQQFHVSLDAEKGFDPDPFMNFIAFSEEMGELAHVLKVMWLQEGAFRKDGHTAQSAQTRALNIHREHFQEELADCLAYLLKLSNYAGIDLEEAYLHKMSVNTNRRWENGKAIKEEK
jgi:deoxyadenosine/deoxycytidine kinase/NTP pyrophosphatase (non-canonical NTP hydrolase)